MLLLLNDTVCRANYDDSFVFGRVVFPRNNDKTPLLRSYLKQLVPVVWSNGEAEVIDNRKLNTNIGVVLRKFKPGDRVQISKNGMTGYVTRVREYATLQSVEQPSFIFKDIPTERLSTIMDFYGYPGSHILFDNWIGLILTAKRRVTLSRNNNIFFSIIDPCCERNVQVPPWMDPYWVADDSMPYPGKQIKLTKTLWQKGDFESVWEHLKSLCLLGKVFVVETIEILEVSVQWLCPADSTRQNENGLDEPRTRIAGSALKRIKNLSIPSYLQVKNGSGRIFRMTERDIPLDMKEWQHIFAREMFPLEMNICSVPSGGGNGDYGPPPRKKRRIEIDTQPLELLNSNGSSQEDSAEIPIVVKVLFTRQVSQILLDNNRMEEIESSNCVPLSGTKREEWDFSFPFGCWVSPKALDTDKFYGIVVRISSASKCIVQWFQSDANDTPLSLEEFWNFELVRHKTFNSLCRGGIVLWDVWHCGVILENFSSDYKIPVRSFSGEIIKLEPHRLQLLNYHGYWDVLKQKWFIRELDYLLNEVKMNPYEHSEETFTNRVQVFENVPSSHIYIQTEIPYGDKNGSGRPFAATILKEIRFLQDHLPPGIWIQFYMDRLDLVSAVIRGAKDTPYEGGLFFFDIKIPIAYPSVPPQVRFRTFGQENELNPNFDVKNGYICSSLLETVNDGSFFERWTRNSNIMQILLSIQGIYLCEHPLFNTLPYEMYPIYQQNSKSVSKQELQFSKAYNQKLSTNLILYYSSVFRNTPSHWRFLVISHFYESLESLMEKLKEQQIMPTVYSLDSSKKYLYDKKDFPEQVKVATMNFELILQDINENKWQLFPRILNLKY